MELKTVKLQTFQKWHNFSYEIKYVHNCMERKN